MFSGRFGLLLRRFDRGKLFPTKSEAKHVISCSISVNVFWRCRNVVAGANFVVAAVAVVVAWRVSSEHVSLTGSCRQQVRQRRERSASGSGFEATSVGDAAPVLVAAAAFEGLGLRGLNGPLRCVLALRKEERKVSPGQDEQRVLVLLPLRRDAKDAGGTSLYVYYSRKFTEQKA